MTQQHFKHRGFTIKVIAHSAIPDNGQASDQHGAYACSVVFSRDSEAKHHYHESPMHPNHVFLTQEHAFDYGRRFAMRVIDDEIRYADLNRFLSARPI